MMWVLMRREPNEEWEYDYCMPSELADNLSKIEQGALPIFCDREDALHFMGIQQSRWSHLPFRVVEVNLEKIDA